MNVDSGYAHKQVNLLQYRRLDGRWQFIRVVRKNGKPDPRLVLVNGVPTSSKGGHFHLAWREEGKSASRQLACSVVWLRIPEAAPVFSVPTGEVKVNERIGPI